MVSSTGCKRRELRFKKSDGKWGWHGLGAYPDVTDAEGFLAEARIAQQLGFIGKSCIHPRQVGLANATFSVPPAMLEEARRIVAASASAADNGHGAFLFEGRMIDLPYLRRAEALLAAASPPVA